MEWRQKTGREKGGEKEIKPHAAIYMDKVNINLEWRGAKKSGGGDWGKHGGTAGGHTKERPVHLVKCPCDR